ncbi:MAG: SDR family NAD(P)-dependent oxidoreductase [Flavobacteriales bacterium]|jgi:NAD(P)-dependent dehydrogenase (short-subunit alcohol dehydrogenase family)|nr:SDR family NAD(P)-dependent oxidoreductase [Flavobacteriales bacterium]
MNNYKNIPNLNGKVAIVTGANSGTGYGITYHLAKHNCKVIMASRNKRKLEDARNKLKIEVPHAKLEIEVLELTSLASIETFAERIKKKYKKIDFLANNAGGGGKYTTTVDGLEENLMINYLGHFALTTQLLPILKEESRIVTFSSIGYKRFLKNDLDVEHLMCGNEADYNQMKEYCKAKLCTILFSIKLQQEFEKIGSKSMALSCHPGYARTNLLTKSSNPVGIRILGTVMNAVSGLFGLSQSLYDGALPAIEALIADKAQPNVVYSPKNRESTGVPIPIEIDHTHYKDEDIDQLWIKTQELIGIKVENYL